MNEEEWIEGPYESATEVLEQQEKCFKEIVRMIKSQHQIIHYKALIEALKVVRNKEVRAILLQNFISEYGPIPDEFGEAIKELFKNEDRTA